VQQKGTAAIRRPKRTIVKGGRTNGKIVRYGFDPEDDERLSEELLGALTGDGEKGGACQGWGHSP